MERCKEGVCEQDDPVERGKCERITIPFQRRNIERKYVVIKNGHIATCNSCLFWRIFPTWLAMQYCIDTGGICIGRVTSACLTLE